MSGARPEGTTGGKKHAWPVKKHCFHSPKSGRGSEYFGGQEGQVGHEVTAGVNKVKTRGIPLVVAPSGGHHPPAGVVAGLNLFYLAPHPHGIQRNCPSDILAPKWLLPYEAESFATHVHNLVLRRSQTLSCTHDKSHDQEACPSR